MHDDKWVIIGLGNEFMRDDGFGLYAVRALSEKMRAIGEMHKETKQRFLNHLDFRESTVGGLEILDYLSGYRRCILIDAVATGKNPPGTIYRYVYNHHDELVKLVSSHQINLTELIGLAKLCGVDVPSVILIYGMEVEDIMTFSIGCSDAVKDALPDFVDVVAEELCLNKASVVSEHNQVAEFPRWPNCRVETVDGRQVFAQ